VPGDTGTQFSISEFDDGPFAGFRLYAGRKWNNRHEFRALYAPLELEVNGQFDRPTLFQETTFAANTDTELGYKFNSYRLTYAYHFEPAGAWNLALGFSAKVRDAEVRVKQGALSETKKNVGFVPLVNFQARRDLWQRWRFRFDLDALAAPQGRAVDAGFFAEHSWSSFDFFTGYRMVEGGADNEEVYNFAWIHQAVVGLTFTH
jgi:hypothetical protein